MTSFLARALGSAIVALFFCVAPALAQSTGSRIGPTPGSVDQVGDRDPEEEGVRVMHAFGRCVARNRPRAAEEILSHPVRSPEQGQAAGRLIGGVEPCLNISATLRFATPLLAGPMAEWLILSRYRNADLSQVSAVTDERLQEIGLAPRTGYEDVALCVARADPRAIRALIDTDPTSRQENAAVRRLAPLVGGCLPQGQTFTFEAPSLRGLVAAGLYRMLSAVMPASQNLAERN